MNNGTRKRKEKRRWIVKLLGSKKASSLKTKFKILHQGKEYKCINLEKKFNHTNEWFLTNGNIDYFFELLTI
ncbi:hypothetical protein IEC97_18920 [Neobacillus cucumis]|uniref:hypothetical protein n=1 Tax=Neobacillus cucumis TaxID=1740721 RepID=UPI0018DF47DD|nr:hypothetical protein [Neobacillus cucumis]MBI0579450.1 hypothetical protein [Neobacillus cucumis]